MRSRRAAVALVTLLALAGCSSDDGPADSDDPGTGGSGEGEVEGEVVEVPGVVTGAGSAAFLPGSLRFVAPCDGGLCVWSTSGGQLVDRFDGGGIVAHSGPGLYTDRVEDGTVEVVLLDELSGEEIRSVDAYEVDEVQDGPGQGMRDLELSPDGTWVAGVGADGVVRLWTSAGLSDDLTIESDGDAVAVAFSPVSPVIAVASSDGPVTLHDTSTGEQVGELDAPPQGALAWGEDGTWLVTASFALDDDAATTVWDAESYDVEATLPRPGHHLAVSGDTVVLSVKDELDVLRWDWSNDSVMAYSGATDPPRAVVVALGGARVYGVSPRDGVLEWTSPDEAPIVFEKKEE